MKRYYLLLLIGGQIAGVIILLLLPSDFFDTGQSICLSKLIADQECIGCGMTRAIQHLIHFDFIGAWNFNKLSFLVFPILSFLFVRNLIKLYKRYKQVEISE